jgi:argininosuccinate lyase
MTVDEALWLVLAAHVTGLQRSDVLEDAALVAIARALDTAREGTTTDGDTPWRRAAVLEERVEAFLPDSLAGAAMLGLAREEWLATAMRGLLRDATIAILREVAAVSAVALTLADAHTLTVMPAFTGGRPAQPTTLGHYLGGLLGPLQTARRRLIDAFPALNRSPLGAGVLAGDVVAADREDLADRLGFVAPVPNTLDAVMGVEDIVAMVEAVVSALATIHRLVRDMLVWIRTDPTSFVLDEGWFTLPEPALPTLLRSERLELLDSRLTETIAGLSSVVQRLRAAPYGPLGAAVAIPFMLTETLQRDVMAVLSESGTFIREGLIVNRAYLGNRAGRGYTTAGDLAAFLMTEEQVPPASARRIAVLVLSQIQQAGLEVSGITQDMIDTAALLTIGREIKVEIESLGRFLAPRRFLERREVTGSPAPAMTRAWLADERSALEQDRAWVEEMTGRISSRIVTLAGSITDAASADQD